MLCYFSPTGTCREAARRLEERFPGACRPVLDLTGSQSRREPVRPWDGLLTLIFPVYAHRVPAPLWAWLSGLPEMEGPVCLICAYGSVSAGSALREAGGLLTGKGMTVLAAAELPGPHCYDCAETKRDLSGAGETDLEGLCAFYAQVLDKASADPRPIALPAGPDPAARIPRGFPIMRAAVRYPAPDPALCTGCGSCRAACPVDAAGEHRAGCIRCGACVRACPAGARKLRFRLPFPALYLSAKMKPRPPRFIL